MAFNTRGAITFWDRVPRSLWTACSWRLPAPSWSKPWAACSELSWFEPRVGWGSSWASLQPEGSHGAGLLLLHLSGWVILQMKIFFFWHVNIVHYANCASRIKEESSLSCSLFCRSCEWNIRVQYMKISYQNRIAEEHNLLIPMN